MPVTAEQLTELEQFFSKTKKPGLIELEAGCTVSDVPKFIQSHLKILHQHGDKAMYDVFYQRLCKLKELLSLEKSIKKND